MVNGWHRFHSVMDNTKHIGFTRNGRAIRFANRPNRPYEQCYNFVKFDRSNIEETAVEQTTKPLAIIQTTTPTTTSTTKMITTTMVPSSTATTRTGRPPSTHMAPTRKALIPRRQNKHHAHRHNHQQHPHHQRHHHNQRIHHSDDNYVNQTTPATVLPVTTTKSATTTPSPPTKSTTSLVPIPATASLLKPNKKHLNATKRDRTKSATGHLGRNTSSNGGNRTAIVTSAPPATSTNGGTLKKYAFRKHQQQKEQRQRQVSTQRNTTSSTASQPLPLTTPRNPFLRRPSAENHHKITHDPNANKKQKPNDLDDYSNDEYYKLGDYVTMKSSITHGINKRVTNPMGPAEFPIKLRHSHGKHLRRRNNLIVQNT